MKNQKIEIENKIITVNLSESENDYISLTDIAKFKDPESTGIIIANWLSTKYTIQFIGAWEQLHNSSFNVMEFNNIKNNAGSHGFILSSSRWVKSTDAIKQNIVLPQKLTVKEATYLYATEADVLNVALFGMTAQAWKSKNKNKEGNMRDYADVYQLVCLANLESLNAEFIKMGLSQKDRLIKLNETAIVQMKSLLANQTVKKLLK